MKKLELIPCKIHGTLPELRCVPIDPTANSLVQFQKRGLSEFHCVKCELEKQMGIRNDLIEAWNRKQEPK